MRETASVPVVVISGPTGTGKSALALAVAVELDGVVINADSRQAYADFPIITAQPDAEDLGVAPHKLYGFLPCRQKLGAGAYADLAAAAVAAAHAEGKLPIVVGGTGLYVKTLLSGIAPVPPVDPNVSRLWRERCAAEGPQALHAVLSKRDPQSAARLHPNDSQRITRALEVLDGTGKPLGHWHALPVPPSPYRALSFYVTMSLDALEPRLAKRIDGMLEKGAIAEAEAAFAACPDGTAPGWSGIGCAELFALITGTLDMAACKAAWLQNTRAYAKRQITWFKRDTSLVSVQPDAVDSVLATCREFYGKAQAS